MFEVEKFVKLPIQDLDNYFFTQIVDYRLLLLKNPSYYINQVKGDTAILKIFDFRNEEEFSCRDLAAQYGWCVGVDITMYENHIIYYGVHEESRQLNIVLLDLGPDVISNASQIKCVSKLVVEKLEGNIDRRITTFPRAIYAFPTDYCGAVTYKTPARGFWIILLIANFTRWKRVITNPDEREELIWLDESFSKRLERWKTCITFSSCILSHSFFSTGRSILQLSDFRCIPLDYRSDEFTTFMLVYSGSSQSTAFSNTGKYKIVKVNKAYPTEEGYEKALTSLFSARTAIADSIFSVYQRRLVGQTISYVLSDENYWYVHKQHAEHGAFNFAVIDVIDFKKLCSRKRRTIIPEMEVKIESYSPSPENPVILVGRGMSPAIPFYFYSPTKQPIFAVLPEKYRVCGVI